MINPLYNISDWTQQSNITQDNDTFKYNSPSLFFATGSPSYIIKDLGRHHNESLTFYLRSDDLVNSSFFVLFGCNDLGDGYAIDIKYHQLRLVTIGTYSETSVILDSSELFWQANNQFHKIKLLIVNSKIQLFFNDGLLLEYDEFTKVGDYIGFHNNNSLSNHWISDSIWYDDQILWGNININGVNNQDGFVLLYSQFDMAYIQNQSTDDTGNWMMFIEEDPIHQNKHVLVGGINSPTTNLQPKGVSSITL